MRVELLYFDGCPNHEALLPRLRELLQSSGVEADIDLVRVEDAEEAVRARFLGSPTIRIDGEDVEPGAGARTDFGLKCRLFATPDGLRGMPAEEWVLAALRRARASSAAARKAVVRRLVDEVMNAGRLDVVDQLYTPELAFQARGWLAPFRESFPDVRMEIVQMVAEADTVAARFICSATHLGTWRGHEPTGRRFRVHEVYFFEFAGDRVAKAWGLEDTYTRLRQLRML